MKAGFAWSWRSRSTAILTRVDPTSMHPCGFWAHMAASAEAQGLSSRRVSWLSTDHLCGENQWVSILLEIRGQRSSSSAQSFVLISQSVQKFWRLWWQPMPRMLLLWLQMVWPALMGGHKFGVCMLAPKPTYQPWRSWGASRGPLAMFPEHLPQGLLVVAFATCALLAVKLQMEMRSCHLKTWAWTQHGLQPWIQRSHGLPPRQSSMELW